MKYSCKTRPIQLDAAQTAIAVFSAAVGLKPRFPSGARRPRKIQTVRLKIVRD